MTFKKLIPLLSGVTLISSGATLFAGNVNNVIQQDLDISKLEDSTILKEEKKLEEETTKDKVTTTGGENYYRFKKGWWGIPNPYKQEVGLSHQAVELISENMKEGIAGIISAITWACPPAAPIATVFAGAIALQWNKFEVQSYDKGNGVILHTYGSWVPMYFAEIQSQ